MDTSKQWTLSNIIHYVDIILVKEFPHSISSVQRTPPNSGQFFSTKQCPLFRGYTVFILIATIYHSPEARTIKINVNLLPIRKSHTSKTSLPSLINRFGIKKKTPVLFYTCFLFKKTITNYYQF